MSKINYSDVGLAAYEEGSYRVVELFAGDTPPVVTISAVVSEAPDGIMANSPVYVDPDTREITIAKADLPSGVTKANAIIIAEVKPSEDETSVPVYKAGCFNIHALEWDTWFGADEPTEAEKIAAFNLAECQIYVKAPFYG